MSQKIKLVVIRPFTIKNGKKAFKTGDSITDQATMDLVMGSINASAVVRTNA